MPNAARYDVEQLRKLRGELEGLERATRRADNRRVVTLREWLELAEAWRITRGLHETNGNRSAAARLLGIGRRTLYRKIDRMAKRNGEQLREPS